MAVSRYTYSSVVRDGLGVSSANTYRIYQAINSGKLQFKTILLEQGQRLDHIAGVVYGDGGLWWIIAAASGIGWALQPPPGTIIRIPSNAHEAIGLIA